MRVFIDADGCPVVGITIRLCQKYRRECILFCDTAHEFRQEGAEVLIVDKGADSVDFAIANRVHPGDLVITQDYGLASMCLARQAQVLHQDGWAYTQENIEALLIARHEARKLRAAGGRTKGPKKRSAFQDQAFAVALETLLQTTVQG